MSRSLSTVLIILLILFTLPIWLGLAGGVFGLIGGLFGAVFGIIGGVFGAVFGAIGAVFDAIFGGLFGWHHSHHWFPHFHFNGFAMLALIIVVALVLSKRGKKD